MAQSKATLALSNLVEGSSGNIARLTITNGSKQNGQPVAYKFVVTAIIKVNGSQVLGVNEYATIPAGETRTKDFTFAIPSGIYGSGSATVALFSSDGSDMLGNDHIDFTVSQAAAQEYSLVTQVSPTGGGSVTVSPNKSSFSAGEYASLTAVPASGYSFSHWLVDTSGISDKTQNPYSLQMNASHVVTAVFTADPTDPAQTSVEVQMASVWGGIDLSKGIAAARNNVWYYYGVNLDYIRTGDVVMLYMKQQMTLTTPTATHTLYVGLNYFTW